MCTWKNRKFIKEKLHNQTVGAAAMGVLLDPFMQTSKSKAKEASDAHTADVSPVGDKVNTAISR